MIQSHTPFPLLCPEKVKNLQDRYSVEGRYYHTWQHIETMLTLFNEVKERLVNVQAVELAIYYHDAIYEPLGLDNEKQSAALLREDLKGVIGGEVVDEAATMIEATSGHVLPAAGDSVF